MKILILGGTKFFGLDFALLRAGQGDDVTVFSRTAPPFELPSNIQYIKGNRDSENDLAKLAKNKWDVVVDNICFTPEQAQMGVKLFSQKTKLWIFVSTGDSHLTVKRATSPFTEDQCEILPDDENVRLKNLQPYGQGKRDAEKILLNAFKTKKFPACIVRFPIVIGPRDPKRRAYSYWLRILDEKPIILPDGGSHKRRYLYSLDAAKALELLVKKTNIVKGEIFHFGDSIEITLREWINLSAQILNKQVTTVDIPSKWLLENNYSLEKNSPYFFDGDYSLDINKAIEILGWKSTPIEDWMKKTAEWYFSKYAGPKPENYSDRQFEIELIKKWQNKGEQ
jgi:nucleoside-diphosphate-sugar epimerase